MSKIVAFLKDESGASAAEYVLILAIIGGGIAVAAGTLATSISGALSAAAGAIDTAAGAFG
jgi:pilus assembly protein Flp/PilA